MKKLLAVILCASLSSLALAGRVQITDADTSEIASVTDSALDVNVIDPTDRLLNLYFGQLMDTTTLAG